jgi:hypothetical protein
VISLEYFKAYTAWLDVISGLCETERGRLFTALLQYAASGEMQEPRGTERVIYGQLIQSIDADAKQDDVQMHKSHIYFKENNTVSNFDIFWNAYPVKVNKKRCREIWKKLNPDSELLQKMLESIERWKASERWKKGYIKDPDTWLRNENWNDDVPIAGRPAGKLDALKRLYDETED